MESTTVRVVNEKEGGNGMEEEGNEQVNIKGLFN